jgi:Tfp pilus assembly protein PilN
MLFLVVISAFLGAFLRLDGELAMQAERKTELAAGIAALQPVRIQRELLMRLEAELAQVVNEFARRIQWSAYTDELASRLPAGVSIRDLRLDEQRVALSASASTVGQVAQFISNFAASGMYKEPAVGQITVGQGRVDFQATLEIIRRPGGIAR